MCFWMLLSQMKKLRKASSANPIAELVSFKILSSLCVLICTDSACAVVVPRLVVSPATRCCDLAGVLETESGWRLVCLDMETTRGSFWPCLFAAGLGLPGTEGPCLPRIRSGKRANSVIRPSLFGLVGLEGLGEFCPVTRTPAPHSCAPMALRACRLECFRWALLGLESSCCRVVDVCFTLRVPQSRGGMWGSGLSG